MRSVEVSELLVWPQQCTISCLLTVSSGIGGGSFLALGRGAELRRLEGRAVHILRIKFSLNSHGTPALPQPRVHSSQQTPVSQVQYLLPIN